MGIIDAVFYLMACFGERARAMLTLGALRQASSPVVGVSQGRIRISQFMCSMRGGPIPRSYFRLASNSDVPCESRLTKQEPDVGIALLRLSRGQTGQDLHLNL
jgi:hypothetical protein